MIELILASTGFIVWSISIILMYYSNFYSQISHIENAADFMGYLTIIGIIYALYKAYSIFISKKKILKIGFFGIIGLFLLHLLILCGFYSNLPDVVQSPLMNGAKPSSIVLFIHILTLLIYPALLILLTRASGYTILSMIPQLEWNNEDMRVRWPIETSIGFLLLSSVLLILSYFFGYTLSILIVTLIITGIVAIPGLLETYEDIRRRFIVLENHNLNGSFVDSLNLKLLSIEFGIFFITFILSVSLINVLRPMPIGWDDLGVYMNFPKIMATSGELLQGGGLYLWQLITGTGFFFSYTAAQAFYVNQLGGILSIIAIICALSYIFQENGKKSFLSLPVLFAAVYYVIPMTVFQQAKDMKLDPALMFFSVSAFLALFSLWKKQDSEKRVYTIIFLGGILMGLAFGVKITTLMLLLGGLGLIAYRFLSFPGFLGYFFLFIAIFTEGNLWVRLNVTIPTDPTIIHWVIIVSLCIGILLTVIIPIVKSIIGNGLILLKRNIPSAVGLVLTGVLLIIPSFLSLPGYISGIFLILIGLLGIIGCFLIGFGIKKISVAPGSWIIANIIFLIGFGMALLPWYIKNYSEAHTISVSSIIGGSGGITQYNFEQFKTKEELAIIKNETAGAMTASGQTQNEDLGRYFGYDTGINNYLKLPANLTFQKNQSGEFTEISYIFLALVPSLLLFVRSRRNIFGLFALGLLILMGLYYFLPRSSHLITSFFNTINLGNGLGYAVMLGMNLTFLTCVHYLIEDSESNKKLKEIIMFVGVYGFVFMISAFGIVWYGIFIYFGFFIIMGLSAGRFEKYSHIDELDEDIMSGKLTLAFILFIFIGVYFIRSVFPHGWNNLRAAYYNEYKYNILSQDEAIFAYRGDYIAPISTLNLKSPETIIENISKLPLSTEIQKFFQENAKKLSIADVHGLILKLRMGKNQGLQKDAQVLGDYLYAKVLYPKKNEANTGGIYRIGTFMTYLINNNRKRYFDDSLISSFSTYIYTPNPEETIERMRKMGLKYLLVDLNAATIDRDPRHDLTDRFEKLLLTMRAKNLRLVDTDNKCLELALDEYGEGKLQGITSYIDIAGTNYESYRSGATIPRNQKLYNCHSYIVTKLNGSGTLNPSLSNLKEMIVQNGIQSDPKKLGQLLSSYAGQSWFALFEIIDIPTAPSSLPISQPIPPQPLATGSTQSGSNLPKITKTGSILASTGKTK